VKYAELGYNSFLIRTILIPPTQSPAEARNAIPTGSLSASQFSMPMNPTTTIVFSSTDYNTAAWSAGIIYFANGTQSLAITAGNTGDITATTYIYYSEDKSPVIQTTTTPLVATGSGKFLLAIVELGVSGKDCKITPTIAAGLVVSGLTAKSISVGQLDALAVNTGTLTVDEAINVGGTRIKFDGANNRILVSDANDGRLVFDNDGTFKISNSGQEVLTATGVNLAFYFNPATNSIKKGGYEISTTQETYLDLATEHFWTDSSTWTDDAEVQLASVVSLTSTDFANCNIYFEFTGMVDTNGDESHMRIYNVTDGAEVSGSDINVTGVGTANISRVRSSALTLATGTKIYRVEGRKINAGANNANFYMARLVFEVK